MKAIFCVITIIVAFFIISTGVASVDLIIHADHWVETVVGFVLHDVLLLCVGILVYIFIDVIKGN